jgi:ectoine hydroxylase-related dioxygenase (phytanoyl-CoA dioxygenase family)
MTTTVTAADWFKRRPWIDEPDAAIEAYVKSAATIHDYDLKEKLESWRENGIVIFEGAVDNARIDSLLSDIDYLVQNQKGFEITVETRGGLHVPIKEVDTAELLQSERLKINNLHTISKAAVQCALNRFATSFLRHVFQDTPTILQSLFFIRGSQQPVHLDYPYVCVQEDIANLAASWVALEDVHEDSGPLAYYCGSQMPEKLPFFDWGTESITYDESAPREPFEFSNYLYAEIGRLNIPPRIFLPRKGDMLIWHAYLAHEGTEIKDPSRTRKSLVTHYTSKHSFPRAHKYPRADQTGQYFIENGGTFYYPPWTEGWRMLPSWTEG